MIKVKDKYFKTIDGQLFLNHSMENFRKHKLKYGLQFLICLWTLNVEKNINLTMKEKICC
jgi:hypothetical protein